MRAIRPIRVVQGIARTRCLDRVQRHCLPSSMCPRHTTPSSCRVPIPIGVRPPTLLQITPAGFHAPVQSLAASIPALYRQDRAEPAGRRQRLLRPTHPTAKSNLARCAKQRRSPKSTQALIVAGAHRRSTLAWRFWAATQINQSPWATRHRICGPKAKSPSSQMISSAPPKSDLYLGLADRALLQMDRNLKQALPGQKPARSASRSSPPIVGCSNDARQSHHKLKRAAIATNYYNWLQTTR